MISALLFLLRGRGRTLFLCLALCAIVSIPSYSQTGCSCPSVATCGPCTGGLTSLKIEYTGAGLPLSYSAVDGDGTPLSVINLLSNVVTINSASTSVPFGGNSVTVTILTVLGATLAQQTITTDCSVAINQGTPFGDFLILEGASLGGVPLCCSAADTDHTAPTFTTACPSNIQIFVAAGTCSASTSWTPPVASDNCGPVTMTSDKNPGDTFPLGFTTVTYTAKDDYNNTNTCSFTVEVRDNIVPQISNCPTNITVSSSTSSCDAVVTWTAPTAFDNCGITSFTPDHNSGDTFPVGTTTVTYTAKDAANNTATCSFTVQVNDATSPVISNCPTNIIVSSSTSSCDAVVTWTAPTASDNCSVVAFTSDHNSGDTFPVGITTVTYTAKDAANNTTTRSFTVEVDDNTNPVISNCPTNLSVSTSSSTCDATVTWTAPTASDNCSVASFTSDHNSGDVFPIGITTVTYTATDTKGNTSTCSFTVTVTDNTAPVISNCPTNISVSSSTSSCDAVVTWTAPTASDNCSVASFTSDHNSGDAFPVGITTVTYTALDVKGNQSTCSFTVEVIDNTAPIISNCPTNISISSSTSSCGAVATWTAPTASDNCSVTSFTSDHNSGDTFPVGITTVIYTAKDAANNTITCSFTVEVIDNTSPVINNCPTNISVASSTSSCDAVVTWTAPTASDNCAVNSFTSDHNSGDTFPIGITTVTYTATDAKGNSSTCSFTVEVIDNTAPTINNCPTNISVSSSTTSCDAVVTWTAPTASDNCVMNPFTSNHNSGDTFPVGITTVTYTATDAKGNSSTCSFTVEVIDNTVPVISNCPTNISVSSSSSSCGAVATWTAPTASDNCAVASLTPDHNSGDTFPVGITTVTYTATDVKGNTSTCSFTVEVIDNTAPVINNCPTNISVSTSASSCDAVVSWTAPTTSDNCSVASVTPDHNSGDTFPVGITTVTYTATDTKGNSSTCSFTVEVIDNTAPAISNCPTNISISSGSSSCGTTVTWSTPTASDNCSVTSFTSDHSSGDTFPVGITTVTYTALDAKGNSNTCSFTVEVIDTTSPVINNCPTNISVTANSATCDGVVTWTSPTATDNCSVASFTADHNSGDAFPVGTTTVTYTAKDAANNTITCSFTVEVRDEEAPVINNCPANLTVSANSSCQALVTWNVPTATDNCSSSTLTSNFSSGDTFPLGTTTVTYTAKDALNNTTTCSFTVTVKDQTNPVFTTCATSDVIVNAGTNCKANASWSSPVATDECGAVTLTSTKNSGDEFQVGTTIVTYTATDGAGNTATCSFNVIVKDLTAPVITCVPDITVSTGNDCSAIVTWNAPTVTDCSTVTLTSSIPSGSSFNIGDTDVTYTATDASGNSSTCTFKVTVEDKTSPVFSNCITTINATTDQSCKAIVNWNAPSATDNCGTANVTYSHTSGSSFEVGTTIVTYTATDAKGNKSTCQFNVVVADGNAPSFSNCPSDIAISADETGEAIVTWIEPIASLSCGTVSSTSTHSPGDSFPVGTTEVTYTATSNTGTVVSCTFEVAVSPIEVNFEVTKLISPNGDGMNDVWQLKNIEHFKDNKVVVIDRWGGVIYSASGYDNESVSWDGTNTKGNKAPTGTYFYTISVYFNSKAIERKGFIELVR